LWKQMDDDKSGCLTKAELLSYFENDEEVSKRLISEVDTNESGEVTDAEWKNYWLSQAMKGEDAGTEAWINTIADKIDERKRKKKKEAEQNKKDKKEFKKKLALGKDLGLDANQDGQITKAELKAYLMKQNGGEVSDQQVEDAYKTLDRDADGNLTVDDCRSL